MHERATRATLSTAPPAVMDRLRVLVVDDSEDDTRLLVRALERAGQPVEWGRVESAEGFKSELERARWDAVIADYRLPHFSAPTALKQLRASDLDLPFIVVSGTVSEEVAVELMRLGAQDYLSKDQLARLAPALQREVREAAVRRARHSEAEAQRLFARVSDIVNRSLDFEHTLESAVSVAIPEFADGCILQVQEDGRTMTVTAPDASARAAGLPPSPPEVPQWDRQRLLVPLRVRGVITGQMAFVRNSEHRHFHRDDLPVAAELARRAAVALDNARLFANEQRWRLEAQEAVRARDEFLSIASHELRTPLAGISGSVQVLLRALSRGKLEEDRLQRQLRSMHESTRRLAVLTDDLLDVSRLRTGQMDLRLERVDLAELLTAVVERQQLQVTTPHKIHLEIESVGSIYADPGRIEQVVTNLLTNAVKYSPKGGEVVVRIAGDGDGALLSVRDEGIGIPVDLLQEVFQPFGRAPNASKRQIPGMGLGLYICRQLVEQHGGRIWAESDGEGCGSTFYVRLPSEHLAAVPGS
ncbi:MAG: hybrid sensor histidine kinase/response regulator [Chloroflexi bacterium]|nr:hybrid sensor histidine kinase/response regulator [Chloroflexota bacterium]